jgi:hypothetical protein
MHRQPLSQCSNICCPFAKVSRTGIPKDQRLEMILDDHENLQPSSISHCHDPSPHKPYQKQYGLNQECSRRNEDRDERSRTSSRTRTLEASELMLQGTPL